MNRILELTLTAVLFATTTQLAMAQPPAASQDDENARIRALFREGAALLTDGKYEEAREVLTRVWQIRQTADIATVLGQAELMSRHFRDAAEHLDWSLRNFPPVSSDERLRTTQNLFADAKRQVGTLQINVQREGVEVRVDGKVVGTSPLHASIFVEPGMHVVAVAPADNVNQRSINTEAGREYVLTFTEQESASHSARATASTTIAPRSAVQPSNPQSDGAAPVSLRRDWTPVYLTVALGGGLTAGSLIAAALFRGHANSRQDEANAIVSGRSPTSCYAAGSSQCARLASLLDDRNAASRNAEVSLGVAGALAVTTGIITYLVWPKRTPAQANTAVWATPTGAGLGLTGTF